MQTFLKLFMNNISFSAITLVLGVELECVVALCVGCPRNKLATIHYDVNLLSQSIPTSGF